MFAVLAAIAVAFALMALLRVGGARRAQWLHRWPSVALGAGAAVFLMRGGVRMALLFALVAAAIWLAQDFSARRSNAVPSEGDDAKARALLGVGPEATREQIRAAYRAKMAAHHPDRGGAHDLAARLTVARDRLLKR